MWITVLTLLHRDTYLTDPATALTQQIFLGQFTEEQALDGYSRLTEDTDDPFSPDDLVLFHDVWVTHHQLPAR